jgi:hypothetical protein
MNSSIFAFATDLADEGIEAVLDNVQHRGGLGGVTVAATYHDGRDIFPHNPARRVRFLESGALFFEPERARWDGVRIEPIVSSLARARDVFGELRAEAERRGLEAHAWTVFLHNDALAARYPDCAPRNAFDDPYLTELCPANPDVRAYAGALAAEVARLGVGSIFAESLHYHPLEHGYAHERYFVELGRLGRYLLGLCFCEYCLEAARRKGVDAGAVRAFARTELERRFADEVEPEEELDADAVGALAGGELAGYVAARTETVTSLAAEAAEAAGETPLVFMDPSGAIKGYAAGRPTGEPAPTIAWQLGIDPRALAGVCGALAAIGYAAEPERVGLDLHAYRALAGNAGLSLALRPTRPDCASAENLAAKLRLAREAGVTRVHLYHYGFMRLKTLDLVREALAGSA